MPRILSGIQSSGALHLGNYFGMIKPAVELQKQGEALYFIANYHSLTSVTDPKLRRKYTWAVALDLLACGLDPNKYKTSLFLQSDTPQVTELTWILSTVTPMGLLERAHSYKDKIARGLPTNHGLFAYPTLMAADILLYDSDLVPVGKDQKQHLEIARDIAIKMNETYGKGVCKLPEAVIQESTATVPGIDGQKMSKSYQNTIEIFGDEKTVKKSVMSIVTDSTPVESPKSTDNSIILELYKLVASPTDYEQMVSEFRAGGVGYGDFKKRLFGAIWEYFAQMREKRAQLEANPEEVKKILDQGAENARKIANQVLARVRTAVGLQ